MVSRQLMAAAVAQQFFGSFIAMETWCDAWLTKGITGYLSYLFTKRTFGNNEYRHWVMKVSSSRFSFPMYWVHPFQGIFGVTHAASTLVAVTIVSSR